MARLVRLLVLDLHCWKSRSAMRPREGALCEISVASLGFYIYKGVCFENLHTIVWSAVGPYEFRAVENR